MRPMAREGRARSGEESIPAPRPGRPMSANCYGRDDAKEFPSMMTPLPTSGKAIRGAGWRDRRSFAWRAAVGTNFSWTSATRRCPIGGAMADGAN